jgi:hypothetical protein
VVATTVNNQRAVDALRRVRDLVEEHGTDEHKERLSRVMGGAVPVPSRMPLQFATYQSEALVIVFEMIAELIEASKPRPRGRPRKSGKAA